MDRALVAAGPCAQRLRPAVRNRKRLSVSSRRGAPAASGHQWTMDGPPLGPPDTAGLKHYIYIDFFTRYGR